jgi:hypothetical protein
MHGRGEKAITAKMYYIKYNLRYLNAILLRIFPLKDLANPSPCLRFDEYHY